MNSIYETDRLLAEYLLFHYGTVGETLPYAFSPKGALDFPARCAKLCFDSKKKTALHPRGRGARYRLRGIGRARHSSCARRCESVNGIDFSHLPLPSRQPARVKKNGTHWFLQT